MTREDAKQLLPIIQAFSEGKEIEGLYKGTKSPWFKIKDMHFNEGIIFRIKPEVKYRPFKNAEECWQEMLKHQPFGWTKLKGEIKYSFITDINNNINYSDAIKEYTFADDTPFGIKE